MPEKLTRRALAATIAGAAAAAAALPAQQPENDALAAAREAVRKTAATLDAFDLPLTAEPAFLFKPF
jgi:hypothetical protein